MIVIKCMVTIGLILAPSVECLSPRIDSPVTPGKLALIQGKCADLYTWDHPNDPPIIPKKLLNGPMLGCKSCIFIVNKKSLVMRFRSEDAETTTYLCPVSEL